jgi:hypothetical protein
MSMGGRKELVTKDASFGRPHPGGPHVCQRVSSCSILCGQCTNRTIKITAGGRVIVVEDSAVMVEKFKRNRPPMGGAWLLSG